MLAMLFNVTCILQYLRPINNIVQTNIGFLEENVSLLSFDTGFSLVFIFIISRILFK